MARVVEIYLAAGVVLYLARLPMWRERAIQNFRLHRLECIRCADIEEGSPGEFLFVCGAVVVGFAAFVLAWPVVVLKGAFR